MTLTRGSVATLLGLTVLACRGGAPSAGTAPPEAPTSTYQIVNVYPHDPRAFTQGLVFREGVLFESTGQRGQSTIRKVQLETGEILAQRQLDSQYFGEGLAESRGRLIQLTWQAGKAFVYQPDTLELERTFDYRGEGWGLTATDEHLIMSDGSTLLRFFDADTFTETRGVVVRDAGRPVGNLNELEVVKGEVYANVWHSDRVARVDPVSGTVRGWIDLSGLLAPGEVSDSEAVLNGIAYDATGDRLFVTGKLWPKLFEIRVQ